MDILDNAWKAATERVDEIGRAREQLTNGIGDRASQMTRDAMQQIGDISQSVEKRLQQFQQPKQSTHERPTTRERVMKMMEGIDNEHRLSRSSSYSSIDSQASTVRSSSRSQSPAQSGEGLSQFSSSPSIDSQASTVRSSSRSQSPTPSVSRSSSSYSQASTNRSQSPSRSQSPTQSTYQSMMSMASSAMRSAYDSTRGHRADHAHTEKHGGPTREVYGMKAIALDGLRALRDATKQVPGAAARGAIGAMGAAQSAAGAARSAAKTVNKENAQVVAGAAKEIGRGAAMGAMGAAQSAFRGARSAAKTVNKENAQVVAGAAKEVGKSLAQSGVSAAKSAFSAAKSASQSIGNYRTDGVNFVRGRYGIGG